MLTPAPLVQHSKISLTIQLAMALSAVTQINQSCDFHRRHRRGHDVAQIRWRLHALALPGSGSHCVIAAYLQLASAAKSSEGRPTLASITAGVSAGVSAVGYWDARSSVSGWARR